VVGHHPHVVQPWERYRDGVIFYSLGNLVFDQFQRIETQHGLLAEVVFAGATLLHAGVMPVDIVLTGPRLAQVTQAAIGRVGASSASNESGPDGQEGRDLGGFRGWRAALEVVEGEFQPEPSAWHGKDDGLNRGAGSCPEEY